MFIGFFEECVKNIPGIYTRQKPQRPVLKQPIRAKIPSTRSIKRDPKAIINGLQRFSRAFHRLHDFTFSLVNQKTLASVIGSVISLIDLLLHSLFVFEKRSTPNKTMHNTCPNRSNHLLQNARVPKFSLMTFKSCLALGNLVNGNMDKNYCRIIVQSSNL